MYEDLLQDIRNLLNREIGLNISTVGTSSLERAIRHRMRELDIKDMEAYGQLLHAADYEVKELIEEVVVPETWFFRNKNSFEALSTYVTDLKAQQQEGQVLRILSIPSSSGEEPYSIAITMHEAGYNSDQYHIDAVDISDRILARAREGVYTAHSFRNPETEFRDRYFKPIENLFVINKEVGQSVSFFQGNLLDPSFSIHGRTYDIVFCRNLLIYFDRPTQDTAMDRLYSLLKFNGILFMGHAENGEYINKHFKRAGYAKAFAYYRNDYQVMKNPPPESLLPPVILAQALDSDPYRRRVDHAVQPPAPIFIDSEQSQAQPLDEQADSSENGDLWLKVSALADSGKLEEATVLCQEYLDTHHSSAQGYYLLGLIMEAQGNHNEVERCYRKAIYLNPDHHEAIIHLSLHMARFGNKNAANRLQDRANRVKARSKK